MDSRHLNHLLVETYSYYQFIQDTMSRLMVTLKILRQEYKSKLPVEVFCFPGEITSPGVLSELKELSATVHEVRTIKFNITSCSRPVFPRNHIFTVARPYKAERLEELPGTFQFSLFQMLSAHFLPKD